MTKTINLFASQGSKALDTACLLKTEVIKFTRREISLISLSSFAATLNAFAQEYRFNRPQETVDYRRVPRGKAQCGNCKLLRPSADGETQGCLVVANPIVRNGSCVLHEFA
jgi:hypothetical protein